MSWRRPRICMLTARDFSHRAFMGAIYEGQDVLLDIDDVDLICLKPGRVVPTETEYPTKNRLA